MQEEHLYVADILWAELDFNKNSSLFAYFCT